VRITKNSYGNKIITIVIKEPFMKLVILTLALISLPAMACPELAGKYSACRSSSEQESTSSEVSIEQEIVNQVHQFKIQTVDTQSGDRGTENYQADGKLKISTQTDPDNGTEVRTETLASCSGNSLYVKLKVTIDSRPLAKINVKVSKINNQLVQVFTGENMGQTLNHTTYCE
jgi:hypothetical protein